MLGANEYIGNGSCGEVFAVINEQLVKKTPYPADLSGYEELGCGRVILAHGKAVLSIDVARIYVQNRCDSFSVNQEFQGRAKEHLLMFKEFKKILFLKLKLAHFVKAAVYGIVGYSYKIIGRDA